MIIKSIFNKSECKVFNIAALLFIGSFAIYTIISDCHNLLGALCIGVFGIAGGLMAAVFSNAYLRYQRFNAFQKLYPIVGNYKKYDSKGNIEMNSKTKKHYNVCIDQSGYFNYKIISEYPVYDSKGLSNDDPENKGYNIVIGNITFSDNMSGTGYGSYRYDREDGDYIGTYEALILKDINNTKNDNITIWIRYSDFNKEEITSGSEGAFRLVKVD